MPGNTGHSVLAKFPWVALANCGQKFLDGISLKDQSDVGGGGRMTKQVAKKPKKVIPSTLSRET